MAQDVVPWGNGLGDLNHPAVVVLDELVVAPCSGDFGAIDEADAVDPEELEGGLVDCFAGVAARGEVIDHWSKGRQLGRLELGNRETYP